MMTMKMMIRMMILKRCCLSSFCIIEPSVGALLVASINHY